MIYNKETVERLIKQYEYDGFPGIELEFKGKSIITYFNVIFDSWEINYFERYLELIRYDEYITIFRIDYNKIKMISI